MKQCQKYEQCSHKGANEKKVCAYRKNIVKNEYCPYLIKNWDHIMEMLINKKKG